MFLLVFSICFFVYRSFSLQKECRILQLNHYQRDRYINYILNKTISMKETSSKLIHHFPFVCLLFDVKQKEILCVLLLVVYSFVYYLYKAKTPTYALVYTMRIKRLYALLYMLYTLFLFLAYRYNLFMISVLALMLINKEMVLLAHILVTPLEKMIQKYYIKDAKKKLSRNMNIIKIGIVGSYGKTSTKNFLFHLLKENYFCLKSKHSYNNLMGNTITIRKHLKPIHTLFLCEMGSDHVGEIKQLMKFIQPQYVMITSIGNQHLNTFISQENIIYEKMSPLLYLKKEDFAILNLDNQYIRENMAQGVCHKITFGTHEDSDYRIEDIVLNENGSHFDIVYKQNIYSFQTHLLGYYNIINIAGCIAMAHTLHVDIKTLQRLCLYLQPVEHRLQSISYKNYTLIDNSFNSNVYSFKNSMDVLKHIKKYRILITPGLIDLKEDALENEIVIQYVKGCCEEVILVGKRNKEALIKGLKNIEFEHYHWFLTMEEALQYVQQLSKEDYVVLIENDIDKVIMNQV